jgi:hypothetical protein
MTFRTIHMVLPALMALTITAESEAIPVPRQKPARELVTSVSAIPIPRPNPRRTETANEKPDDSSEDQPDPPPSTAIAACRSELQNLDIVYTPRKTIGDGSGCGAAAPIEVTEIAGVVLTPPATINCAMARGLHQWITEDVKPAAMRRLKTKVTALHVAASYVCRRRNNAIGGKLSEHAKANALDISGFSFAKTSAVSVGGGGSWGGGILKSIGLSKSGSFLGDIREGACSHFTTVLGPGSDRYHGDHFHVDALQRKGGYRICK